VRYVVHGAGAIGGTIGARLHRAGRDVVLIARGAHLSALRADGLRLQDPDGEATLRVPVAASPAEAGIGPGDVVLLTVKSQDTAAALEDLAAAGTPAAVVCGQNGVENERLALRRFPDVYGMLVVLAAQHLEPGVVQAFAAPVPGVLDVGRVPAGADERARAIAADLAAAGFSSRAVADVMRLKHGKLVVNMANTVGAVLGAEHQEGDVFARARAEAVACLEAAGIPFAPEAELTERYAPVSTPRPVAGAVHSGSSSWQSLARGAGRIEADYLSGEVVLLGRLHGVPTPVNAALQRLAARMARERLQPGALGADALAAELAEAQAGRRAG
jgi:2-dehydropantoate 2-reductase